MTSSAARGPARSGRWFAVAVAVAVVAAACAVLLHHHARGRIALAIEQRLLAPSVMSPETGLCHVAILGVDWLSGHRGPSPARLLEDGRDLGPANASHDRIRSDGGGAFSVWRGQVYFSTSDGTDPRSNGRRYEIVWQTPVAGLWEHLCTAIAVLAAALACRYGRRFGVRPLRWAIEVVAPRSAAFASFLGAADGRRAWRLAAGIGVVAIAVRLVAHWIVQHDLSSHISGGLVMGVPFSDAQGWDNQGASIMAGHGLVGMWSARRPFYAFVLGALYTWTGPSAFAVVVLHMLVGGLTAALVCRIGQLTVGPVIGVLAGLAFAFDPVSIEYSEFVLTETIGTFLFVLCVHQLVLALTENRAAAAWWGGLSFVLSNLTRTLTLPAAPLLALILLWRGSREGRGWRRGVWLAALFSLGCALPLGTWIVRQKAVHDLTTISDNTASGLYAAASPKYGTWSSLVDREAEEAGIEKAIKPRYDWFMARFRAELAADPSVYARNVVASAVEAMRGLGGVTGLTRGLLVVLILAAWLARLREFALRPVPCGVWSLLCALMIAATCKFEGALAGSLGLVGLLLGCAMRRDRALSIAVAGYVGTVGAVALFALGSDHRLLLMTSWMQPIGLAVLAIATTNWAARRLSGSAPDGCAVEPSQRWAPRWQRFGILAFLVFAALNLGWLAWRNYVHPEAMLPPLPPPTTELAQALVERLGSERSDLVRGDELRPDGWYRHGPTVAEQVAHHGEFVVASARLSRHRYPITADTRVTHWSRMFDPRPYDRTFTYAETYLPDGARGPACVLLTAPLPAVGQRDVVLLGRANVDPKFLIEECYLEVLAWAPLTLDGSCDPSSLQIVAEPGHAALVNSLRR